MMTFTAHALAAFGLIVSEKEAETLLIRVPEISPQKEEPPTQPPPPLVTEAASRKHVQTTKFRHSSGLIYEDGGLTQEITAGAERWLASESLSSSTLTDRTHVETDGPTAKGVGDKGPTVQIHDVDPAPRALLVAEDGTLPSSPSGGTYRQFL